MILPYDLAEKMKRLGFPQEIKGGQLIGKVTSNETAEVVYSPLLEEVLAELGEDFESIGIDEISGGFIAFSRRKVKDGYGRGKTLVEAACNLWCAVKEKE